MHFHRLPPFPARRLMRLRPHIASAYHCWSVSFRKRKREPKNARRKLSPNGSASIYACSKRLFSLPQGVMLLRFDMVITFAWHISSMDRFAYRDIARWYWRHWRWYTELLIGILPCWFIITFHSSPRYRCSNSPVSQASAASPHALTTSFPTIHIIWY